MQEWILLQRREYLKKLKRSKSNNLEVLKRFYRKVLAKLRVEQSEEDKKIGVVIKGTDFIKNTLKEIILENSKTNIRSFELSKSRNP